MCGQRSLLAWVCPSPGSRGATPLPVLSASTGSPQRLHCQSPGSSITNPHQLPVTACSSASPRRLYFESPGGSTARAWRLRCRSPGEAGELAIAPLELGSGAPKED